jgi:hypothetical protein
LIKPNLVVYDQSGYEADLDIVPYFNFIKEEGIFEGQHNKIKLICTPLNDCVYKYKPERSFEKDGIN